MTNDVLKREKCVWTEHLREGTWKSEYPSGSLFSVLEDTAKIIPNNYALDFEGNKIKFKDLIKNIKHVAKCFSKLGLKKGDTVTIISPNLPQAIYSLYAVNLLGGVANMIHPMWSQAEIKRSVNKTNSKFIVILDQIFPKIAKLEWEGKPTVIITRVIDALPAYAKPVYGMKTYKKLILNRDKQVSIYWNDFIKTDVEGVTLPEGRGETEAVAIIMGSGGTTGDSKWVMLTNLNYNSHYVQTYEVCYHEYGWKSLALMPIFHGYGFGICIHSMLCCGFFVQLIAQFDFEKCIKKIFKNKIRMIYGIPGFFEAFARCPQIETQDLSFIKMLVSAGGRLPVKLKERIDKLLKKGNCEVTVREAFGQTECSAAIAINPFWDVRSDTAGIAYPDVLIKIVKLGTTEEVPVGEAGELCVSGSTVMKGYLGDEEATANTLKVHADGRIWEHTGDLCSIDKDGYLHFYQRINRMAKISGFNVYLSNVEEIAMEYPAVKEAVAVAVDAPVVDKKVVLYVELHNQDADTEAVIKGINNICRDNLPEYSLPSQIVIKAIPHTPMGKPDYRTLEKGE